MTVSRFWRAAVLALVCAIFIASPSIAQPASGSGALASPAFGPPTAVWGHDEEGRVLVHATRATGRVRVDGRLDDEVYQSVPPITQFIQQVPNNGAAASERTEIWVLYDDENVYVACRCWDSHPDQIKANDMRRGSPNIQKQDHVAVNFDTMHDRRNSFLFYMTPNGAMREAAITDDSPNHDWRTVWESKAARFDQGWTSEIAIPFKSLRYGPGHDQTWGIQMRRFVVSKNEKVFLTPTNPGWGDGAVDRVAFFATLEGLQAPPSSRNLEVRPFALNRTVTDLASTPKVHSDQQPDAGVDVKYGITKSLIGDFTYRTDFAEVEEDNQVVNLTRFSQFFAEKRPFFLEGQGIFGFAGTGGEAGSGDVPVVFYSRRIGLSDAGRVVPVIGGARLSGKAGLWSIGALNIETDEDKTAGVDRTNYSVLRVKRNVLRRSTIGGIFTHRSVSALGPGANDVWGLDSNFLFLQNLSISSFVSQSSTENRSGDDWSYQGGVSWDGDRYGFQLDHMAVQKNFNPEVGFVRREDFRRSYAQARFSPRTTNNRLIRQWAYQGNLEYTTDNTNFLQTRILTGLFGTEFQKGDTVTAQLIRDYEYLPTPFRVYRGVTLPVAGYEFTHAVFTFAPSGQRRISGRPANAGGAGTGFVLDTGQFYDGTKQTFAFNGRVDVTPRLGVEPSISLNWVNLPKGDFTSTVVGARTIYTMTPRMYAAALIQYSSGQALFSTNLRFRWEYKPGSEMFVVYTDGRSTLPPHGTELLGRGLVIKVNRLFRF
jgi:hypothetical protein